MRTTSGLQRKRMRNGSDKEIKVENKDKDSRENHLHHSLHH